MKVIRRGLIPPPQFKFKFVNWGRRFGASTGRDGVIRSKGWKTSGLEWSKKSGSQEEDEVKYPLVELKRKEKDPFVYDGVVVGEAPGRFLTEKVRTSFFSAVFCQFMVP